MPDEQQRITVLLVDDEENILRALKRLLMDEDFDVETAESGEAGLEKLQSLENVGLIVSDQRMPGMNGAEFLGRSQEFAPNAQRILLTGYSDINATIEAINKGGASRYLSKPWDDDELTQVIRDAVALYLQGEEKRRLNDIINQQKRELEEWNVSLKKRLLQSSATIREQSQAIKSLDDKNPMTLIHRAFDGFFEIMGDRNAAHARTVSTLVTDVARKMGLDAETVAAFRLAALLHDAGKFGCLPAGMNKHPEEMSESESAEYRQHPLRGEDMFRQVEELAAALPLIRSHHEAYDGSGFPDGLSGESIPLGARLIAIADHIEKCARSVEHNRADYALMSARFRGGTLLDPMLIARFQGITKVVYFEGKKSGSLSDVEVGPHELIPGMVLARDVESGSGVLLMQRGSVLDLAGVTLIRIHYRKNPPSHGIFVQIVGD
ncbi:MAG: response regulator [Geobacter sp.]|nr:response regulator [Geobacter sp.]